MIHSEGDQLGSMHIRIFTNTRLWGWLGAQDMTTLECQSHILEPHMAASTYCSVVNACIIIYVHAIVYVGMVYVCPMVYACLVLWDIPNHFLHHFTHSPLRSVTRSPAPTIDLQECHFHSEESQHIRSVPQYIRETLQCTTFCQSTALERAEHLSARQCKLIKLAPHLSTEDSWYKAVVAKRWQYVESNRRSSCPFKVVRQEQGW